MKLKNRVAVITGGSKGFGRALAEAFVREGARVVISARGRKELGRTTRRLKTTGYVADVSKEKQVKGLAAFVIRKLGRIDIWINNAGIYIPRSDLEHIDTKKAHSVMEVNFFGTFYGSREALKVMKKQGGGTILNIVSSSALIGRPRSLAYSASKWAARGFTEGLRMAAQPHGISVLAVHPGGMRTSIFGKKKPEGYAGWMNPSYAAERVVKNLKRASPEKEQVIEQ
ncbi:MAG: hypothetical protein A3K06_03915 [Candidatus Doudnabacteria bacterium RIFCSPHIGHO2_01_52_17]|uniref:Short-chain dehydrogenase n=1 Tax=Candidatus Doudnabacteria bacterium RIFCSPHIGHO2_01_52_17 TaxID=1817820 RepID=A0A1F5NFG0_9BACT|nr:MAG: hypothetical protein A3K06_03915 [Candidatus Doudnabacteria bacterium RIFCSPHIGHO2_01_52_17]